MPKKKSNKVPMHPMERAIPLNKMSDITWRIFRIMSEFVEGFQFLSQFHKEVTIFGSARLDPKNKWCKEAEKLGKLLAKNGYTVITGGGPGIMEAANKGAYEENPGKSIGINIQLPSEQRTNEYVTKSKGFYYFFTRKVMLAASAQSYIFFPGGYGTADEFMEILMLIQTKKMQKISMILVGKEFWTPLVDWFQKTMVDKYKTVNPDDLKLFSIVDKAEDALKIIRKSRERTIF
ncbi:MAG: TIGR00730 family Rossman fold protein [Candidatus Parcubacteria bacterium]|nr:TIGR00730 family Rossman fold protein [Candidatus Parcubacteria bacterium]